MPKTEGTDDILQHTHYQAIINDDFPRWKQREIGRFLKWEDARNATIQELDSQYPGMWEVNFEDSETTSQYIAKEPYYSTAGFCMAVIHPHLNEREQLEKDIEQLSKELKAKRKRLAILKGQ